MTNHSILISGIFFLIKKRYGSDHEGNITSKDDNDSVDNYDNDEKLWEEMEFERQQIVKILENELSVTHSITKPQTKIAPEKKPNVCFHLFFQSSKNLVL